METSKKEIIVLEQGSVSLDEPGFCGGNFCSPIIGLPGEK